MKKAFVLILFLVGCRSPVKKPDGSQFVADGESHATRSIIKADPISYEEWYANLDKIKNLNPNSRTSKIMLIKDGEKIQVGNVAISVGDELKYYTISSEGIYEYDPNSGKKGRKVSVP